MNHEESLYWIQTFTARRVQSIKVDDNKSKTSTAVEHEYTMMPLRRGAPYMKIEKMRPKSWTHGQTKKRNMARAMTPLMLKTMVPEPG